MNKAKIFMLPTQHFDLIWRKPVEEYRSIRCGVIHRLLDLLEEFPEFKVTLVQALALMDFIEDAPEDKDRLVRFIGEGRLEVAWGGLSLIDQGVICGESIVRNLLYGKMWLKDELCANVKTANFSDAFGINGQIPQIIRGFGVDSLTGARMSRAVGRMHLGNYGGFMWKGLDGSGVIVYENALGALPVEHMGIFYGWGILEGYDDLYRQYMEGTLAVDMKDGVEAIFKTLDCVPGDPVPIMVSAETHLPSREVVAEVLNHAGSHGAKFAVQSEYIECLRKENLPVLSGEFNPELTGCYSTRTSFKQYNRRVERNLLAAEMLSSLLEVNGAPRPQSTRDIWTRLALAQFHDSLGGCIDDESGLFVESMFKKLLSDTGELCLSELMRAASVCSTEGPGDEALVVFNPSPHRTEGCVFIPGADGMVPVDGQGRGIPAQRVNDGILMEMPLRPSAISVSWLRPGEVESAAISTCGMAEKETDYYNIEAAYSSLRVDCKKTGGNLFKGLPHLLLLEDTGTLWCEEYTGREASVIPALSSVEDGPLAYTLVYRGETSAKLWKGFKHLSYTLRLTFFKHSPRIGLNVSLDWAGKNTKIVLKLPFDYPEGGWTATHSVPFGSVLRPDYEAAESHADDRAVIGSQTQIFAKGDWPTLFWVDVRAGDRGFALLNDGTPAHRVADDGVRVALLRSGTGSSLPCFPVVPGPLSFENGMRNFNFTILAHKGEADTGVLDEEAFLKPLAVRCGLHSGADPESLYLVKGLPGNISLSCVKPAEDGGGLIFRFAETGGMSARFVPVFGFGVESVRACNLQEEPGAHIESIEMHPYKICSIYVRPVSWK